MAKAQTLATAFGGLSSAIGIWYAIAPRHFLQTIGMRPTHQRIAITRLVAAQEISVGGALLTDGRAGRWLAMRVAGDALHGVMVGMATQAPDNDKRQLRVAWAAWLGITVADVVAMLAANRNEQTGAQLEQFDLSQHLRRHGRAMRASLPGRRVSRRLLQTGGVSFFLPPEDPDHGLSILARTRVTMLSLVTSSASAS